MQEEKSNTLRPHKLTYKVSRELAISICKKSKQIKAYAFYLAIKHYSQSSSLNYWRKNIGQIRVITGINSENTIRKRIKECYQYGFFHGEFSNKHLRCKKTERILPYFKIPLHKESVISISKTKLNGVKQIENFIKICAFDRQRERQIYAEKKTLAMKKLNIKSSNKEKLSKSLLRLVKKEIQSVDERIVLKQIRAGRRKLGKYIQRSGSTATRVIKAAKEFKLVKDIHYRPQLICDIPANFQIDDVQFWAKKKFKTFAFYKEGAIWIKFANSVALNPINEYNPIQNSKSPKKGQSVCFIF